ncbi:hypothetical protein AB1L06_10600 [Bacillus mojavensis]
MSNLLITDYSSVFLII